GRFPVRVCGSKVAASGYRDSPDSLTFVSLLDGPCPPAQFAKGRAGHSFKPRPRTSSALPLTGFVGGSCDGERMVTCSWNRPMAEIPEALSPSSGAAEAGPGFM